MCPTASAGSHQVGSQYGQITAARHPNIAIELDMQVGARQSVMQHFVEYSRRKIHQRSACVCANSCLALLQISVCCDWRGRGEKPRTGVFPLEKASGTARQSLHLSFLGA